MTELKPCPFCGHNAFMVHGIDGEVTAITCNSCKLIARFKVPNMKSNETFEDDANRWIDKWNMRFSND